MQLFHIDYFSHLPVTLQVVKDQLQQEPGLKLAYDATVAGWPKTGPVSREVQDYYRYRDNYQQTRAVSFVEQGW